MKAIISTTIITLLACLSLQAKERPNIVLIFLDDAAYSDFRPFGNPPYATPNVERLAAEGVRYTRFHVPQAVCSACRAALLTGCYPHRNRVVNAIAPGFFIGAVLLWDVLFRGQLGVSLTFIEELQSRNLANLFVSPLRLREFIAGQVVMSVLRTLIGVAGIALGVATMLSVVGLLGGAVRMFERILRNDSELLVFEKNVSDLFFSNVPGGRVLRLLELFAHAFAWHALWHCAFAARHPAMSARALVTSSLRWCNQWRRLLRFRAMTVLCTRTPRCGICSPGFGRAPSDASCPSTSRSISIGWSGR